MIKRGAFIILVLCSVSVYAQISINYPGDSGIENDPDVILSEQFDGTVAQIVSRWNDVSNSAGMSLLADVPEGSASQNSILMTSNGGTNSGGHLYKKLDAGEDTVYLRYYIKYYSGGSYHHTGGRIGGYNPPTVWPQGGAGLRPTGSDSFSSAAEPVESSGRFDFYTYWMGMHSYNSQDYYGNDFIQDENLSMRPGEWMCVELMAKMNDPVSAKNGEMAMWIDDEEIMRLGPGYPNGNWIADNWVPDAAGQPFEGFQWRNTANLDINWIWLLHYVTDDPSGYVNKVQFSDVVAARKRIGCISQAGTLCGNGICESGESSACPSDCNVSCIHTADNDPCNGCVSITELDAHINSWLTGEAYIVSLMDVIRLWKGGCQ
jgi:hypothetical protein